MTLEEAQDRALELLGLDEFQRIAVMDLHRGIADLTWPPEPGSQHETKLIEIGRLVSANFNLGDPRTRREPTRTL